jgi:hypothetical protein
MRIWLGFLRPAVLSAFVASMATGSGVPTPLAAGSDSCELPPPCEAFWEADAVFVGRVLELGSSTTGAARAHTARLEVLDAYRGLEPGQKEVTIDMPDAPVLTAGGEYFIYGLASGPQRYRLGTCTRTTEMAKAVDDRLYVRTLPRTRRTHARVFGTVTIPSAGGDSPTDAPRPPVTLVFTGPGSQLRIHSDDRGRFEDVVPPGSYTVSVETTAPYTGSVARPVVEIRDPRACVKVDVTVQRDTPPAR